MASKFPASDDFDEQFLTCSICMRYFQDPRVLPCLHTFCRECLKEWATKQQPLECPTCRTQVSLPDQGVDGLRTNFYVNNLLDFAAAKKGAEPGVPCQVCEGNVEGSKSWCADCAILMCESCTMLHRKFPYAKDHEVTTEETLKAEEGRSKFHRKRHCDKHKNQELVFYCESCSALVCTACTVVDHRPGKDHNPVEITTVAQRRKEKLQSLLQDIDPRLKEIQASVKEVERKLLNLAPSKEAATDQAKAYFRQLTDLLKKREKEILSHIDEQCRADGKALQTKKEAIEFELAGLTSAQTFCQQAVEHGSDVHILEVGNQVQTRVETLLAKQLDLESDWSEFQFVENTAVSDFEKEVQGLGGVNTNVDVSKCEVAIKPAVQGCQCIAELTTMDQEGRPCVTNSKAVTADMKDPSGMDVPTQVQIKSWGKLEISYVPKVTGDHRLEVKVNSQQVPGCPFEFDVKENPVLASLTKIALVGAGPRRLLGEEVIKPSQRELVGVGELDGPVGVAVDKDGNIAVVEQGNKRVQIFDADTVLKDGLIVVVHRPKQKSCLLLQPDGSLIREIGKGQLQRPLFVSVDESRDVMYVTDKSAHKVFAFDLDGNLKFDFGSEGQNDGEFQNPEGVTVDQAGNIIVSNAGNGRVQVFGPDGTFKRKHRNMASNMPDDFDDQFLTCPVCMLHFRDPRVLPCLHTFCRECLKEWATKQQPLECPTCRTQPDGSLIREIGKGQLETPVCVTVDESRDVMFVTDDSAHKVFAFDLDGNQMFDFGKEGQNVGEFKSPEGVTLDTAGNIIVVSQGDGRLQMFGPDGTFKRTVATVKGGNPHGIGLTPDGYIAVACFAGHRIERYRYM
ncbi:tripartite motif-containing protein 2-like [Branchiostoma floridae]|uniref:RING-type E3 ubiquitin transferase n=3 Tax=Branchiostoma floridae TaxID=7739 RepID=A0A9J7NA64_BRAFL|nr:tripartite motif-containing protein 2-like [Branchiostoma floridae]